MAKRRIYVVEWSIDRKRWKPVAGLMPSTTKTDGKSQMEYYYSDYCAKYNRDLLNYGKCPDRLMTKQNFRLGVYEEVNPL